MTQNNRQQATDCALNGSVWFGRRITVAILINVVWFSGLVLAADIGVNVSSKETYVGQPVKLQIEVRNASNVNDPQLPDVDGMKIRSLGPPATKRQVMIINGKRTENKSSVYSYYLTPLRAGTFRIPSFQIEADGETARTAPLVISATESETGDLLFVEIRGAKQEIYVGEPLPLTLTIWIRPYADREYNVQLSEGTMWQRITQETEWGDFGETLQEMYENNRRPRGEEVDRPGTDGQLHTYYRYELETTVYPQRSGPLRVDEVRVVVDYPVRLSRSRGLFSDDFFRPFGGSQLSVRQSRPIVSGAEIDDIQVLPVPSAGRPDSFRGAVGQYQMAATAHPTDVSEGDPITLQLTVVGSGRLDLLQAPDLSEHEPLTASFRVPDEALAGVVDEDRKVFSTTIRPRKAGETEIPPIPFSFFDPDAKQFVTVETLPIPISVSPADRLAMDSIISGGAPDADAVSQMADSHPNADANGDLTIDLPFPQNGTTDNRLNNDPPIVIHPTTLATAVLLPPLCVLALQLFVSREIAFGLARRFRSSINELERNVATADSTVELRGALIRFLVRSLRLDENTVTEVPAVGRLRKSGLHDIAVRLERIFARCDQAEKANRFLHDQIRLDQLKTDSLQAARDLQAQQAALRRKPNVKARDLHASTSTTSYCLFVLACLAVLIFTDRGQCEITVQLSDAQRRVLLQEADAAYSNALRERNNSVATNDFQRAVDKYQTLVDSGIRNSRLYTDLGNARVANEQFGEAVECYERALELDPTNDAARGNRAFVLASHPEAESSPEHIARQPSRMAQAVLSINRWLNRFVHPHTILHTAMLCWSATWGIFAVRLLRWNLAAWRLLSSLTSTIAILASTSYGLSVWQHSI